jgi:hypothetical protein
MTQFVVENNKENYPIINELVSWHQQYYFKNLKFKPYNAGRQESQYCGFYSQFVRSQIPGKRLLDNRCSWRAAFNSRTKNGLDTAYVMTLGTYFLYDAWAELYTRKK